MKVRILQLYFLFLFFLMYVRRYMVKPFMFERVIFKYLKKKINLLLDKSLPPDPPYVFVYSEWCREPKESSLADVANKKFLLIFCTEMFDDFYRIAHMHRN